MTTAIVPRTDLTPLVRLVTDALTSPHSKRAYSSALRRFGDWYTATAPGPFSRPVVHSYRAHLETMGTGRATINLALAALRKLAQEATDGGMLAPDAAMGILRVHGVKQLGLRTGNWLDKGETVLLLAAPDRGTLKGQRDAVILDLLLGCGLRRAEACCVTMAHLQARDGRPCIVNLAGKGGRLRTVPLPAWMPADVDAWTTAAHITDGRLLRSVGGLAGHGLAGRIGDKLSPSAIWLAVRQYGTAIGRPELAPHDLRRTFARLAERGGAGLRRVQQALGHSSVSTTERYLGAGVDLADSACDYLGVDADGGACRREYSSSEPVAR